MISNQEEVIKLGAGVVYFDAPLSFLLYGNSFTWKQLKEPIKSNKTLKVSSSKIVYQKNNEWTNRYNL